MLFEKDDNKFAKMAYNSSLTQKDEVIEVESVDYYELAYRRGSTGYQKTRSYNCKNN